MHCPIEKPLCKRMLMTNNEPLPQKQCPINIKPKCSLLPPTCPLLPQPDENTCGYAKLLGQEDNIGMDKCPCKSCFCTKGCPIKLPTNKTTDTVQSNKNGGTKWSYSTPPCLVCKSNNNQENNVPMATDGGKVQQLSNKETGKIPNDKTSSKIKNAPLPQKCKLTSNIRPLPCAECLLQELGEYEGVRKVKPCPYLVIPDTCNKNCCCPEIPKVEGGPICPFAPIPCPCCATPRCPLSRQPDCVLQPKPPCCLLSPKCSCGPCLPPCMPCKPSPCCCGSCSICLGPCKISCSVDPCPGPPPCPLPAISCCVCPTSPCCTGKCCLPCSPPGCPVLSPCFPCPPTPCPPLPCSEQCQCDPVICSVTDKPCPLAQPCCSSPCCVPCLLRSVQCILDPCPLEPNCPPIPPPCSLMEASLNLDGDKKTDEERTFHLPTCPLFDPPCEMHILSENKKDMCPFAPNPCPCGTTCPFPVSKAPERDETGKNKNGDPTLLRGRSDSITKSVQFNEDGVPIVNENQPVKRKASIGGNCPYSSECGIVPVPECPAAEILSPETYNKPKKEKVKKKTCPFKKCMDKQGCPLSELKPKVDCKFDECPLKEDPDCPCEELAKRCPLMPKCTCCCPPPNCCSCSCACCCTCQESVDSPLVLTTECGNTRTDGTHPLLQTEKNFRLSSNYSSSTFDSFNPSSKTSSSVLSIKKNVSSGSNFIKKDLSISFSKTVAYPLPSINSELPHFDGGEIKDSCEISNYNSSAVTEDGSNTAICPFEPLAPKRICPLAPPKCPLTPKPTTCPLTRKPDPCPLSAGKAVCPVSYPPCAKFPAGRCPMDNINVCDCEYPVSPCLAPYQEPGLIAPPQYCFKEDCCMGLPYPPSLLKTAEGEVDKGPFYQYRHTKPGKEETKYFVKVSNHPFSGEINLFGQPKKRLHDNWTIVKHGEGYLQCKTLAKKFEDMGPIDHQPCQYSPDDCPIDEETRLVLENRKNKIREERELETIRRNLGYSPEDKKPTKKNKK